MTKKVIIIGAGNIGSRHLQALRAVKISLEIIVVDPAQNSLNLSKERYQTMPRGKHEHKISFFTEIPDNLKSVDLGIIATCSDTRAEITRKLLAKTKVRHLVLEKLLFNKKKDYKSIGLLLKKNKVKTWVNCPMRMMPLYKNIQPELKKTKIAYYATWAGFGLITSAIHYLDHMVFMTGSDDFTVNTDGIDSKPIPSKRKGFLELSGTLQILFKNGSVGNLACFINANLPILIQFHCEKLRCIARETEAKAWISRAGEDWKWKEIDAQIPFQSQLTTGLAEDILSRGECGLVGYEQSAKTHLQLLEPVFNFLNKNSSKKYDYYPFT
ncbi:MAG: hypothetical protein A2655_01850 [Candidatus Yanofskybacteria bacterium RIFCSPHIGHO2_01_FULL_43_42]|uniref:Gfo/Idh/MocA-like oxidoreductase N-terminal domain-containing protein n=1 Tax=Candidatus Yanofskybacteria bacterium RIFCSPLOWO2_01_FULL_43_22 TaxID=1802695 RepID=A0A1F8GH47_9BACT|nr:MAG: hypothetical protein A2655_01850 [Candidatus Yanofskybacteria bacterium RIFCSPHIGHO2_01_FULL_43_42]OGN13217.1 MAG: hypothetical protein A3D48_02755 [Candidatus Yanofskybacteria bacterium RIFCSPHIGHO2_02_FULL_43_17]OGN24633.1 MAG: hypothetical protein A3A13_00980 [Candidatus Yanofskybacteria bacterium RIFCSPLOWO2_01_FULL_43_22]